MKAFVLAEHTDAARGLCAAARTVADDVTLVAIGDVAVPESCADEVAKIALPEGNAVENAAETVCALADEEAPEVVFAEPTRRLKIVAGRLAAHLGASVITDVTALNDGVAESMYFGGLANRKMKAVGKAVYTMTCANYAEAPASGANAVKEVAWVEPANAVKVVSREPIVKSGIDLTKADVVVSAGRGFAEEEQLDIARALCDKLGAGLGCTRPLTEGVDWLPRETYIGVSGLTISPKVYIAAGVSGQMQHMVGCNTAGTIFAINTDKNAPIFKQCDYGIVGDLKTVLPAITEAL